MAFRRSAASRRLRAAVAAVVFVPVVALAPPIAPASATDGDLDPSYGEDGIGTFRQPEFPGIESSAFSEWDSVVDNDGRFLVVGVTPGGGPPPSTADTILIRYTQDGRLDDSFGVNGVAVYDVANGFADAGKSVAVLSDGDYVIGGELTTSDTTPRVFALRINNDGSYDTGFGGGSGRVILDPSAGGWSAGGELDVVGADPAEQIYLGAWREGDHPVYVARLNGDGSLDTSFGGGGDGVGELDFGGSRSVIYDLDTGPDGGAYVATEDRTPDGAGVGKLTGAGLPDTDFAGDGTTVLAGLAWARAIDVASDRYVAVAHGAISPRISLLTPDGDLDPAFAGDGTYENDDMLGAPDIELRGIRFDVSTDEIYVFGGGGFSPNVVTAAARVTRNGALNPDFGGDGNAQLPACEQGIGGQSGWVQSGTVYLAGGCEQYGLIAGVLDGGTLDTSFSDDGVDRLLPITDFFAIDSVTLGDGSTIVLSSVIVNGDDRGYLVRYDQDGQVDTSYNATALPPGLLPLSLVQAEPGSDHVIVVGTGGAALNGGYPASFAARLDSVGNLVATFGSGGLTGINFNDTFGDATVTDAAIQPDGQVVAGGSVLAGAVRQVAVTRLDPATGAIDEEFGAGGVAVASAIAGTDNRGSDVTIAPGGEIIVLGQADDGGEQADTIVLQFLPDGALDGAWGGDGSVVLDQEPFGDDLGHNLAVGPGGQRAITYSFSGDPGGKGLLLVDAAGAPIDSFDGDGRVQLSWGPDSSIEGFPTDLAFDDSDRLVVVGHDDAGTGPEVKRFLLDGSQDPEFAGGGSVIINCPPSSDGVAGGLGFAPEDDDILVSGSCNDRVLSARVQASGSGITNLDLTVTPDPATLNALDIPIEEIDRSQLMPDQSTLVSTPWRTSPWRVSPWRVSPWRVSPWRVSPWRVSPWRVSPWRISPTDVAPWRISGPPILLSSMPLHHPDWPEGWQQVLDEHSATTAFRGRPAQSVTMAELPDAAFEDPQITMEHIDFTNTPIAELSIAALLYGKTTLQNIDPGRAWAEISGRINGVDVPADQANLTDLHFAGVDLTPLWTGPPIHLNDVSQFDPATGGWTAGGARPFAEGSPMATMHLNGLDLRGSRLGKLKTTGISPVPSEFFSCQAGADGCRTLAEAQQADALTPAATLTALLEAMSFAAIDYEPGGGLQVATLADVVAGFADVDEFPYEDVPLEQLLAHEPGGPDDGTTYTVDFDLACSEAYEFDVELRLPHDIQVGETAQVSYQFDNGDGSLIGETTDVALDGFTGEDGFGYWLAEFSYGEGLPPCDGGTLPFTVEYTALGSAAQRAYEATAFVDTGNSSAADTEIVDPSVEPFESGNVDNNVPSSAPTLTRDRLISGYISSQDDLDYFRVNVGSLPEGTRVSAVLSHLPEDYDLVVFGEGDENDPANGTIQNSPWRISPWRVSPWRVSPVEDQGLLTTQGNNLPSETLQDIPWRVSEVANTPWRTSSTNRGTTTEVASTTVKEGDGTLTIQVSGYEASSPLPYVIRLKIDEADELLPCVTRPYPPRASAPSGSLPSQTGTDVDTLVLVNEERLRRVYGTAAEQLLGPTESGGPSVLHQLASASNGLVIPVDRDPQTLTAYDAWDLTPCSIQAANDVVGAVNRLVDTYQDRIENLKHIVLVGDDELLPHARVEDETTLGNQVEYRRDAAFNGLDNPISRAFARHYIVSDDPYGDFDSADGKYYLPDVGLGRLVETPQDIAATISRYLTNGGVLNPSSSFTTGYDFLTDGATAIKGALERLSGPNSSPSRIDEGWTANDVITALQQSPAIASINAHYNHYGSLPALDHAQKLPNPDVFETSDLTNDQREINLANALLFTIGCNAGVSFSDVIAALGPGGSTDDPTAKDWAQVTAQKGATFAGNTGFGYGDTETVALSERLFVHFADRLASKAMTIGQAFAQAKQDYNEGPLLVDDYDHKVTQQAVLYGLPMFRVGPDGAIAADLMPEAPSPNGTASSTTEFDLSPYSPAPADPRTDDDAEAERGRYWRARNLDTASGLVQPPVAAGYQEPEVTHYRPLQPKVSVPITSQAGQAAHGVVIEDLESIDIPNVNPVYAMPTRDDGHYEPEPIVDEVFFPSTFANLSRTRVPGQVREKLNLVPGQFFTPDGVSGFRTGTQRLFTRMAGEVLHSASNDFIAPQMRQFEAYESGGLVTFSVDADDPTGTVERVLVLYRDTGSPDWKRVELLNVGGDQWAAVGALTVTPNGPAEVTDWFAQAVDDAKNVAVASNKGRFYPAEELTDGFGAFLITPAPNELGFYTQAPNVKLAEPDPDSLYELSVNGGTFRPLDMTNGFTPPGDGVFRVVVRGSNGEEDEVVLLVDADGPAITVDVPDGGETFSPNDTEVTPVFTCDDNFSGVASCAVTAGVGANGKLDVSAPGDRTFTVTATDVAGNQSVKTVTYVVRGDDIDPTIDIDLPTAGQKFLLNQPVTPVFTCADNLPGVSCVAIAGVRADGKLDTSSVGPNTFTVKASDAAGNEVVASVNYRVVYEQHGFISPVDNLPTRNVAKAGSTIPVKFKLTDYYGNPITSTSAIPDVGSRVVSCASGVGTDTIEETAAAGGSTLRYDATNQNFIYNWKSQKGWTGCRMFVLSFDDGDRQEALFEFRK